jgi:hypothetical protein
MRFGMSSEVRQLTPLRLPSGRARLAKAGGNCIARNNADRNRARHVLRCHDRLIPHGHDDVHFGLDQLAGQARELRRTTVRKTVVHHDPLAFGISEFGQTILEEGGRHCGAEAQITDFRKALRRLRDRGTEAREEQENAQQQRHARAAQKRDELSPPHPSRKDGSKPTLDAAVPRRDHGTSLSVVFYTEQRRGAELADDCQWAAPRCLL